MPYIQSDYSRPLGDAVKRARGRLDCTQNEVATRTEVEIRTISNIENYRANPEMKALYPLIRFLKIDPREIFYPEMASEGPHIHHLRTLIDGCSDKEAEKLIPVFDAVLHIMRTSGYTAIEG